MSREEMLNECVSRDKAIVQLNHLKSDWDDDWNVAIRKCIETIKSLPSATPQQKMGRLILLDECSNSGYYCSECQKKVVKEGWSNTVKKIKYCPNCGSKIQEVEE